MKRFAIVIFSLLVCCYAYGQVDNRLIGTWSETANSTRLVFTIDALDIGGEKTQIYTEFGRIISAKSNQILGTYRFCTPEEFAKSVQTFIDAYCTMVLSFKVFRR